MDGWVDGWMDRWIRRKRVRGKGGFSSIGKKVCCIQTDIQREKKVHSQIDR